jgi:hypothetical protein
VRDLIARTRERGTPIASACAGTFLLAETGILDELRATTTWWLAPVFRARYPAVHLDDSQMVITPDRVTTAGAAFGHVDLALSIVRASSPALADMVARYLVVDERPAQSAYTIPSALAQSDPTVAAFERWTRDRLAQSISIPAAAKAIGVSERALQRSIQRVMAPRPSASCKTCVSIAPPTCCGPPTYPWKRSPGRSATNSPTRFGYCYAHAPARPPRRSEAPRFDGHRTDQPRRKPPRQRCLLRRFIASR